MSRLRPECGPSTKPAIPYDTALYLIRDAVARRGALCYGMLDDARGRHCAMGAFFADHPGTAVTTALLDEVATVNDLKKDETPRQRWERMRKWLRWKVRVLATGEK